MELVILWIIIAVVFSAIGDKNKRNRRRAQQDNASPPLPRQSNAAPKQKKQRGLLDGFLEQLRELEEQERQKAAGQQKKKQAPATVQRAVREDEEEALLRFRKEQDEKNRQKLRRPRETTVLEVDNYALRERSSFSIKTLEEKFPAPEQRMIVFSEILDKPKALRRRG